MSDQKSARLNTQLARWKLCVACDKMGHLEANNHQCNADKVVLHKRVGDPAAACPLGKWRAEREVKVTKLILRTGLCAGDIVQLLFAIESLCTAYPDEWLVDVRTYHPSIFEGCPHITPIADGQADLDIEMHYRTIEFSNQKPYRFLMGYLEFLEDELKIKIPPANWHGFLRIRDEENGWFSAPREILGEDVPYWVVDAGHKTDYAAKAWEFARFQKVAELCPDITFVQIGMVSEGHVHPELKGKNVIDLKGKTDLRQLIRLVYNAFGVLTPVSLPMMLAFAVPAHPRFMRQSRACIVLAGGREPNHWQAAADHQYLHSCGMLPCCDLGGCWASRVVPLHDAVEKTQAAKGEPLVFCREPVTTKSGQVIPLCMDMITAEEVAALVRRYDANLNWVGGIDGVQKGQVRPVASSKPGDFSI